MTMSRAQQDRVDQAGKRLREMLSPFGIQVHADIESPYPEFGGPIATLRFCKVIRSEGHKLDGRVIGKAHAISQYDCYVLGEEDWLQWSAQNVLVNMLSLIVKETRPAEEGAA